MITSLPIVSTPQLLSSQKPVTFQEEHPKWRQNLVMLAQEAGLTDGEADVQSHRKSKVSYLRLFADGEEIADRWTLLTKSGHGRVQTLPLFSSLPSLESMALSHSNTATRIEQEILKRQRKNMCGGRH